MTCVSVQLRGQAFMNEVSGATIRQTCMKKFVTYCKHIHDVHLLDI